MPYHLPSAYRFSYDFAVYLHDFLAGLVKAGEVTGAFKVRLHVATDDPLPPEGLAGKDLSLWLDAHYTRAAIELAYKSLLAALLADSCHFIWESLRASARGKQTVAYDLIRKSFKESLFYLEWLLADPAEFLQRFNIGPDDIAVEKQPEGKRRAVIEEALLKSGSSGLDASFLYEVRYDRNAGHGYAVAWDQAIHLVTTFRQAKTSRRNLNLILSSSPGHEALWEHYYRLIPYLLYHMVCVSSALLEGIASFKEPESRFHRIRRDLGFVLHSEWILGRAPSNALAIGKGLLENLTCAQCGSAFALHRRNLKSFVTRGKLACRNCRTITVLPQ